jgi:hypothetical protein
MVRYRDSIRGDLAKWAGKTTLHNVRHQARAQGVLCNLTGADVKLIYDRQDGRCALTGRKLIFGARGRQRDSLSIDRIGHGGDYTVENVRLVTYQANMARGMFSDEELYAFCEAALRNRGFLDEAAE